MQKKKNFAQKCKLELMHEEDILFIKTNASFLKLMVVRQRAEKHRLY